MQGSLAILVTSRVASVVAGLGEVGALAIKGLSRSRADPNVKRQQAIGSQSAVISSPISTQPWPSNRANWYWRKAT